MKRGRLALILSIIMLSGIITGKIVNKDGNNKYFNSLLSIESAKKLYRKKHYESSLEKLLKIAGTIKNNEVKAQAVIEIAYVKFLMGYSFQTYKIFIIKAVDLFPKLEINENYKKEFIKKFKTIKKNHRPKILYPANYKNKIIVKPSSKTVKDMEIKENLIFKMKKELITLKETETVNIKKIRKQEEMINRLQKTNNSLILKLNKISQKFTVLKKSQEFKYKKKYLKIKSENKKIKKEKRKIIYEKEKIISKLKADIIEKDKLIKTLKEADIAKQRDVENLSESKILTTKKLQKKENVFITLQKIWNNNL